MNIALNYVVLIVGLAAAAGLWILFASDVDVRKRSKRFALVFMLVGIASYTVQYFGGLGL